MKRKIVEKKRGAAIGAVPRKRLEAIKLPALGTTATKIFALRAQEFPPGFPVSTQSYPPFLDILKVIARGN